MTSMTLSVAPVATAIMAKMLPRVCMPCLLPGGAYATRHDCEQYILVVVGYHMRNVLRAGSFRCMRCEAKAAQLPTQATPVMLARRCLLLLHRAQLE